MLKGVVTKYTPLETSSWKHGHHCPKLGKLWDRARNEACQCNPKRSVLIRKKWYHNMSFKTVRGGVMGFGDTLVSKTCLFFFGGAEGASKSGILR